MVKGATQPCQSVNGEYLERQGLDQYQALGYVPFDVDTNTRNANSIYGSPEDVWGSAATTLEYAVDDFSIAQLAARSQRDRSTYRSFMRRSANWRRLYDPASGMIEPRYSRRRLPPALRQPRTGVGSSRATPPSTPGWFPRTRLG